MPPRDRKRFLYIPHVPMTAGDELFRRSPWRELESHGDLNVFDLPGDQDTLGRFAGPAALDSCLARARSIDAAGYDYIVGHANSFLWMSIFRLARIRTPFAIVPNYNHVHPYDAYALALAAHFRVPGDRLFTGSRAAAGAFGRFGFVCAPHHAPGIVLHGFGPDRSSAAATRERFALPSGVPLLLYTGRLQPDKSVYSLILAHREIKKQARAHLVISSHIAYDEYAAICRQLAGEVGDVTFVNDPTRRELIDLYSVADIFVLFGVSEWETFGISPIEAMACATAPVVPKYDGFAENIPPDAGVLVETYGDFAARRCSVSRFAETVAALLADRERLSAMGQRSLAAVERFDNPVCVDRFVRTLAGVPADDSSTPETARLWSNSRLPASTQSMAEALEGQPLYQLLADFLQQKSHRLEATPERIQDYRRTWFSSFFPD